MVGSIFLLWDTFKRIDLIPMFKSISLKLFTLCKHFNVSACKHTRTLIHTYALLNSICMNSCPFRNCILWFRLLFLINFNDSTFFDANLISTFRLHANVTLSQSTTAPPLPSPHTNSKQFDWNIVTQLKYMCVSYPTYVL